MFLSLLLLATVAFAQDDTNAEMLHKYCGEKMRFTSMVYGGRETEEPQDIIDSIHGEKETPIHVKVEWTRIVTEAHRKTSNGAFQVDASEEAVEQIMINELSICLQQGY